MDDAQIHDSIEQLVAEEHQLWGVQAAGTATDADRRRLEEVRVSLDRCWDLLRQRRALEEFGMDPDAARARSDETVERYEQ
jgi:chromosome condensin MukBEF MukE localization factor